MSWEPLNRLKNIPQSPLRFSTIGKPILRFVHLGYFLDFVASVLRFFVQRPVSPFLNLPYQPITNLRDPDRKMRNLILLLMERATFSGSLTRAELSHFPSKNLPDSPFQRGGRGSLYPQIFASFLRFFASVGGHQGPGHSLVRSIGHVASATKCVYFPASQ